MWGSRSLLQLTEPGMTGSMDAGSVAEDFQNIANAAHHIGLTMQASLMLSLSSGSILQWLAVAAAVYLFIVNRTNWRTDILTSLLVPYIFLNLPELVFGYTRGEIGLWIAFVLVVLKLFFPQYYPEHADLPAALILLLVTAPHLVVALRVGKHFSWIGDIISIIIGFYLLYEHIINGGGLRKAFADRGVIISIGILLLFVAPVWQLIFH